MSSCYGAALARLGIYHSVKLLAVAPDSDSAQPSNLDVYYRAESPMNICDNIKFLAVARYSSCAPS